MDAMSCYTPSFDEYATENRQTQLTAEMVLQALLAGFAGISQTIFDAIPKEQNILMNGKIVAQMIWQDLEILYEFLNK